MNAANLSFCWDRSRVRDLLLVLSFKIFCSRSRRSRSRSLSRSRSFSRSRSRSRSLSLCRSRSLSSSRLRLMSRSRSLSRSLSFSLSSSPWNQIKLKIDHQKNKLLFWSLNLEWHEVTFSDNFDQLISQKKSYCRTHQECYSDSALCKILLCKNWQKYCLKNQNVNRNKIAIRCKP